MNRNAWKLAENFFINSVNNMTYVFYSPRTSNKFNILVNVERNASVVFKLKYQELLKRTLGSYHHVIYVDPGQIVEDFEIKVYISESRDIIDLSIPPLDGKTKVGKNICINKNLKGENSIFQKDFIYYVCNFRLKKNYCILFQAFPGITNLGIRFE